MKTVILAMAISSVATSGFADASVNARVKDHYTTVYNSTPVNVKHCYNVDIPVYETRSRQGNAAEGAILGMIIGGLAGKAVTGKDNGAAAGAVMGGVIGADKGSKPKSQSVIVGYKTERQCETVVEYKENSKKVYSYSTLLFTLDGKQYRIDFNK